MLIARHQFKPSEHKGMVSEICCDGACFFFGALANQSDESLRDQLRQTLEKAVDVCNGLSSLTLAHIQASLNQVLAQAGERFSFAGVCRRSEVLYLFTRGKGRIYLERDQKVVLLIEGDKGASGKIRPGDSFVLTCEDLIDDLNQTITRTEDAAGGLFVFFEEVGPSFSAAVLKIQLLQGQPLWSKRRLTFLAVLILFIILVWSVVFGVKRRAYLVFRQTVNAQRRKIEQTLAQIQTTAVNDQAQALKMLDQAKQYLNDFQKIVGSKKIPEISVLTEKINNIENAVIKKEEKRAEEFYDLTLIENDAAGIKLAVDGDRLAVLNPASGKVYLLSLAKKSTQTLIKKDFKAADLLSVYDDDVFVYQKDKGILTVNQDGKLTTSLPIDADWGEIIDLIVYNVNIYLVDRRRDEIYKYLRGETGYSAKTSYFKSGQGRDLAGVKDSAIDGAVYLLTDQTVYKYTGGGRDQFSLALPDVRAPNFDQLFTDKTTEKVYLLAKKPGKVFVLSKNGIYEKQIAAEIFQKAEDFMVREKNEDNPDIPSGIFVLSGNKLYRIELD